MAAVAEAALIGEVKVDSIGRIYIPVDMRVKALINPGDVLKVKFYPQGERGFLITVTRE